MDIPVTLFTWDDTTQVNRVKLITTINKSWLIRTLNMLIKGFQLINKAGTTKKSLIFLKTIAICQFKHAFRKLLKDLFHQNDKINQLQSAMDIYNKQMTSKVLTPTMFQKLTYSDVNTHHKDL